MNNIRIGSGFDVHKLVDGRKLIIGGVHIPYEKGLLGHSDADVLIHSICDALLGAANMGDIGKHFPDSSIEFKDIDSKILLKKTNVLIKNAGYRIGNIDCTICAHEPKLSPFVNKMQNEISKVLNIETDVISIKATSTEGLGFVGRKEGICSFANVLLFK